MAGETPPKQGEIIREALQAIGMTPYAFAKELGVSKQTVYNAIHGVKVFTKPETIERAAEILQISPDALYLTSSVDRLPPDIMPMLRRRPALLQIIRRLSAKLDREEQGNA